jgi:predicted glycoside hydrolase/deacetylase ChbG (UPF0249 family)
VVNVAQKFLIINADDVGCSPASADALAEAVGRGTLTSCSLIANSELPGEIAEILKSANPRVDLGIHVNLTEGAPTAPPEKVRSLVGNDGRFTGLEGFIPRWAAGRINKSEVGIELRAQFRRLAEAGVRPIHIDGHHNLHLLPGVAGIAAHLAREFGARWFRPRAALLADRPRFDIRNIKYAGYNLITVSASEIYMEEKMRCPEAGFHLLGGARGFEAAFLKYLSNIRSGVVEYLCHPMIRAESLSLPPGELDRRRAELEFLLKLDPETIRRETGFTPASRSEIKTG